MKKINKILILALVACGAFYYSCETIELENTVDPNVLSPDKADAVLLFNKIQIDYVNAASTFNDNGAELARIEYFFGRNYQNALGSGTLNGPWNDLYSDIIPDITAIAGLNSEDNDLSFMLGASKAMQAHLLMLLVDYLGDVPFSEINNPGEFPAPKLDPSADVYAAARALLDEAKSLLTGSNAGAALDLYYGGDEEKWIKFVNTLKMRADLTTRNYAAVINATDVIETMEDDMAFKYGTNQLQPDVRHPDYADDYTDSGANLYQSNWLMNLMVGPVNPDASTIEQVLPESDPRRRYYFFRQTAFTPGNFTLLMEGANNFSILNIDTNGETLQCSLQNTPNHLQFTPDEDIWCSVKLGYWGRTHGNDEGTPPDNFTRTAMGVYPAGGSFDDNPDFVVMNSSGNPINYSSAVGLGKGGGGAGIEPIIMSSFVEFWRAEAYLMTGDTGSASEAFEAGITESIDKVQTFGSLDGSADLSFAPSEEEVQEFIDLMVNKFDSAPLTSAVSGTGYPTTKDKMDLLGEQFFVAMFGDGADAYNFIRRTGYPRTIAREIEPNPGTFPRTFFYPSSEVTTNPNINQKSDLSVKTFWDTGVTNPAN